ncbi:mediator of RNA polymerase II transcription subunit 27-like, partial [Xiphias gladius]|uniref:mediator of RNA polymerase II transcription subunit 27-like n=1 Tax=Xiphias gladius TaxID=8245 RepID=UPI001A993DEF
LQYHAGLASSLLNQQSLKRSANQMGASAKRRPKVQPSTLVLPPQYVDDVISRIGRMFPDMTIELFRPNGTSAVLLCLSLYPSLPVCLSTRLSTCFSHLQTWLRSYIKLFQSSCQRCGRFLQDGLPPTWRDFRTLEAFHDTCRM